MLHLVGWLKHARPNFAGKGSTKQPGTAGIRLFRKAGSLLPSTSQIKMCNSYLSMVKPLASSFKNKLASIDKGLMKY